MLALSWAPACYSGIDAPDEAGDDGTGDTGDTGNTGDGEPGDGDPDGDAQELPAPSPRVYRLTHEQWENTVQDLFGFSEPTGQSMYFREDPLVAGFVFDNDVTSLEVDNVLWTGYRLAAAAVAEQVSLDATALAELTPPDTGDEAARIDTFVRSFGERAYRRPLEDEEVVALTELFQAAPALYTSEPDAFVAGIRHVVEAVLQSPFFLYRVERSSAIVDDMIPLSDYEIASRLSYFLWNTMPDPILLAAAAAGELHTPAQVAAEAARMLEDPRAADMVVRFHHQLLDADKMSTISPSAMAFPDAPADLPLLAVAEHEAFVRDVVFGGGGGLVELLTSSQTFLNEELAAIYGVQGVVGPEFVNVELDPNQRRGVFTQVGFLAANSTALDPDPIHRGVFLAKRMACLTIAAPPDGVPPLPPTEPDQTNRERVEGHTEVEGSVCISCHGTYINPYGFPFEGYDALGAWRTTDNGQPVDTATNVTLDGATTVPVADALDLMDQMAGDANIHRCYAQHWVEYATGRNSTTDDQLMIERLGTSSLEDAQSIRDLLVAVSTSPAFLNRSAEELP